MMSGMVWLSAWPMCSEPVTFGGGITMLKRGLPDEGSALKAPMDSQNAYQRGIDLGMLECLGEFTHRSFDCNGRGGDWEQESGASGVRAEWEQQ